LICALVLVSVASAEEKIGPRISHTFPPPEDIRNSDRTLVHVDAGLIRILVYSPDGRTLIIAGIDNNNPPIDS
jgi:hypothetical protein